MKYETIVCPFCGNGHAHITYEENRVYQMNCPDCHNAIFHRDTSWDNAVSFFKRMVVTDESALRQQETVANRNGLNEPLTLDELREMDGEPVWWWNKSAKPVCTICVWDRFMNEPMFANYDWQSEDTLKLSKYKWLKKCGYKPYRQKPEEDDT